MRLPNQLVGLALLFLAAGCSAPQPYPNNPAVSDAQGTPRDSTSFYFRANDSLPADDDSENCSRSLLAASKYMVYFERPVLSNYYLHADVYRFLWLRAFDRPVLLTLYRDSTGTTLRTQILRRHLGYKPGTIPFPKSPAGAAMPHVSTAIISANQQAAQKRRTLRAVAEETITPVSPGQWQHLENLVQQADFWQMPPCRRRIVLDGASWLLEGHTRAGYHTVLRTSPAEGGFRAACEYLLDLSSARNEKRY
ncbi:hypothetical protein LGH70_05260 [Hymenobacter sp. BT635]|uniref:Lipoprotein n=1 Tax=Hymenobacter nitidus TaxID=2880929 RepID=A0ABS8A9A6_9BACT|nr:hypothetical protein [Hymenobacter nitidus]MCB2376978.1 hypothetical protein [Hymenobacter nitidus]